MSVMTPKMKRIYEYILRFYEQHGYAPTYRDIMREFGFTSAASAHKYVYRLAREGFLRRLPRRHRGIELLPSPGWAESGVVHLPLMGYIAAGHPIEKVTTQETVPVPQGMIGHKRAYVLRVRGHSMIEDHILDGDYIIVEDRPVAHNGEIVVAEVDGEVTLKRFYTRGGHVVLQPANAEMAPLVLPPEKVRIHGVAIGLFRRL